MRPLAQRVTAAWFEAAPWLWLLSPLAVLFWLVQALRRRAYRWGWLNTQPSPIPVVVVGNITVGGSGKSPIVAALVKALQHEGLRVGVVSRGYGSELTANQTREVSRHDHVQAVGDEPLMLKQQLSCPVVIGRQRSAAVAHLARLGCQIAISDDGLQHYAMARTLELCVLDAKRAWGNGLLLPAGPLREPVSRLRSVDAVIVNGQIDAAQRERWVQRLQQRGLPVERQWFLALKAVSLQRSDGAQSIRLDDAAALQQWCQERAGQTLHAVAGIGHPERFFQSLADLGLGCVEHAFADHHRYTREDFAALPPAHVIMTEKDAVKCRALLTQPFWVLQVEQVLPTALISIVSQQARAALAIQPLRESFHG